MYDTKHRAKMVLSLHEQDQKKDHEMWIPTTAAWLELHEYFANRLQQSPNEYRFAMPDGELVIHGDMDNGTFTTTVGSLSSQEGSALFWFLWRVIVEEYPATPICFYQGLTSGRFKVAPLPLLMRSLKPTNFDWQPGVSNCRIYPVAGAQDEDPRIGQTIADRKVTNGRADDRGAGLP